MLLLGQRRLGGLLRPPKTVDWRVRAGLLSVLRVLLPQR
jgi:hypothetical protein